MIDKAHIRNFLHANGVSDNASDEEIRGALRSARWGPDDIERSLHLLHGDDTNDPHDLTNIGHRLFRSDSHVEPQTLSSLLGVKISFKSDHGPLIRTQGMERTHQAAPMGTIFIALGLSIVVAFIVGIGVMYMMHIGPFYSPLFVQPII